MVEPATQKLISKQLFDKFELAFFCVDHQLQVDSVSDNLSHYGYHELTPGVDVCEHVDFMVGMDFDTRIELPLVSSPSGIPVSVTLVPSQDLLTVLITDASMVAEQRQQLQQQANDNELLVQQQRVLMTRLEQASLELETKNKQLEEAARLQISFLSGVSHEFRTPLTSIIGYTNLLKKALIRMSGSSPDAASTDTISYLHAVQRSGKHLLSLVENLLDHGKLNSDEIVIRPKPVNLREVFDDIELLLRPLAETKNIEFHVDLLLTEDQMAVIDDSRLRQCLINLVGNAIKFTDIGSVALSAKWRDEHLNVVVSDTGPGISATDLKNIRKPFWQGADTGKAGTGLGLTITEQLIELMGGELHIDSKLDKGTEVRFSLPVASVPLSLMNEANEERESRRALNVLLAEDDSDIAALVSMMLVERGIHVQHVENGALLMDAMGNGNIDLVLMDIHMPIMSGYQVLEALQDIDSKIPIIVMSASSNDADRARAERLGCYAYLVKPVDVDDVLALADDIVGAQEATQA